MFLKKGVLPPYGKIDVFNFSYPPLGPVKSPLIRRFGLEPQWVRTLSTHAIASQAQSHRLNGNLTGLDRNSLSLVSEVLKKGALPLSAIGFANFAYPPNSTRKRREATFAVIKKRFTVTKFKNTARGVAALSRLVKLPFRRRLEFWRTVGAYCSM